MITVIFTYHSLKFWVLYQFEDYISRGYIKPGPAVVWNYSLHKYYLSVRDQTIYVPLPLTTITIYFNQKIANPFSSSSKQQQKQQKTLQPELINRFWVP